MVIGGRLSLLFASFSAYLAFNAAMRNDRLSVLLNVLAAAINFLNVLGAHDRLKKDRK